MTVTWHVDDLKISHKESTEVTKFIHALGTIYGDRLSVTRGKIHSYLAMNFDYTKKGTVRVAMVLYSKLIKDDFPEPITSTAPSPAADRLFRVRPDDERK